MISWLLSSNSPVGEEPWKPKCAVQSGWWSSPGTGCREQHGSRGVWKWIAGDLEVRTEHPAPASRMVFPNSWGWWGTAGVESRKGQGVTRIPRAGWALQHPEHRVREPQLCWECSSHVAREVGSSTWMDAQEIRGVRGLLEAGRKTGLRNCSLALPVGKIEHPCKHFTPSGPTFHLLFS